MSASDRGRAAAVVLLAVLFAVGPAPAQRGNASEPWDHSSVDLLQGPFGDGPDVTQACITCHADAAADVMATVHWTWEYFDPVTGAPAGKRHVYDNTWVSLRGNEARCTSCHIGFGWDDEDFDFREASAIDCLVCHDTTGTYAKFPDGAGHPVTGEAREFDGVVFEPVDLVLVAGSVGTPERDNCTACHVAGGGGGGANHTQPVGTRPEPVDVHMDPAGPDFPCQQCHVTGAHQISGGRPVADWASGEPAACERCHSVTPHDEEILDGHVTAVACQTCHIPSIGGGAPVATSWDWSVAGAADPDGNFPLVVVDDTVGRPVYDSRLGALTWERDIDPVHRYSNGTFDRATADRPVDAEEGLVLDRVLGGRGDGRIWPFQVFTALQPYDPATGLIAPIDLYPSDDGDVAAFWRSWDLTAAVAAGVAATGGEFGGELAFIESSSYRPITHGVVPADQALRCTDCHAAEGRLDFAALGYTAEEAAMLSIEPSVPEPPPVTTTTAAPPPSTTAAVTTTTVTPATTAPATTTSIVAAAGETDDGFDAGFAAAIAAAVAAAGAAVGAGIWVKRRR